MDEDKGIGRSGDDGRGDDQYGQVIPGPGYAKGGSPSPDGPAEPGPNGPGLTARPEEGGDGWTPPRVVARSEARVVPMRDFAGVDCETEVEIVVTRFTSFGRLAHLRRSLLALPQVSSARITRYSGFTAFFSVTVAPGTKSGALALPGTQLIGSDGRRIELRVAGA